MKIGSVNYNYFTTLNNNNILKKKPQQKLKLKAV